MINVTPLFFHDQNLHLFLFKSLLGPSPPPHAMGLKKIVKSPFQVFPGHLFSGTNTPFFLGLQVDPPSLIVLQTPHSKTQPYFGSPPSVLQIRLHFPFPSPKPPLFNGGFDFFSRPFPFPCRVLFQDSTAGTPSFPIGVIDLTHLPPSGEMDTGFPPVGIFFFCNLFFDLIFFSLAQFFFCPLFFPGDVLASIELPPFCFFPFPPASHGPPPPQQVQTGLPLFFFLACYLLHRCPFLRAAYTTLLCCEFFPLAESCSPASPLATWWFGFLPPFFQGRCTPPPSPPWFPLEMKHFA